MDALQPRLLTARFPATFAFYNAVLPRLAGAVLAKGAPDGPYANWDVDGEGLLALLDRAALAKSIGTDDLPAEGTMAQDRVMLVCRVDDVDGALDLCLAHGGTLAAPATARPEWGATVRTAHVRDPDGNLMELQSY